MPKSICDACSQTMPDDEAQTCEHCGGTYCEQHIGDLDHDCEEDDDSDDSGPFAGKDTVDEPG